MMDSINAEPGNWAADDETRGFVRPIGYARAECEGVGQFALYVVLALLLLLAATSMRAAPFAKNKKELSVRPNVASESLAQYVERVRTENLNVQATPGSIWTDSGRLTRMSTDVRAMRPHDLISVVVMENMAASRDGTVKNSRSSSANSQVASLLGNLHPGSALQNLVNQSSSAALNAQGVTQTNSSLSTVFGGQVVDVLPNGMLVIEAARQVEFSQQTETIVLRGLVRPEDISQQNQVLSTAISSLELEVRGKGIISDYTRRPNILIRLLQQLLIF